MMQLYCPGSIGALLIAVMLLLSACGTKESEQAQSKPAVEVAATVMADRLTAQREAFMAKAPAEAKQIVGEALDSLMQSGLLESALNVGDTIPRFELGDALGETVSASDLLAKGPVVLVFYRGNW